MEKVEYEKCVINCRIRNEKHEMYLGTINNPAFNSFEDKRKYINKIEPFRRN